MDWEEFYRKWGPQQQQPGERPLGGGLQPGLPQPMQEQVAAQAQQAKQEQPMSAEQRANNFDQVTNGLMQMATAFEGDGNIQVLPSPYKGGPLQRIRGGGMPGLQELMAYITAQGRI
jgi:hypothetical protein